MAHICSILRFDRYTSVHLFYHCFSSTFFIIKGARPRNVNKLLQNDDFVVFLIGHITEIFHYLSQNEGVILKMGS